MSSDMSNYDIYLYKGNTFKLDFIYTDSNNNPIDLTNYTANMQVRRSAYDDLLIAELNENYPTGSFGRGLSGDFISGEGLTGYTGGIILNYNGITGNIHIELDSETSYAMPIGKNTYDFQLYDSDNLIINTIRRGRFEVFSSTIIISRELAGICGGDIG